MNYDTLAHIYELQYANYRIDIAFMHDLPSVLVLLRFSRNTTLKVFVLQISSEGTI
jgi:hypothetical protein